MRRRPGPSMPSFFLASSVVALLVALFNALLAGYVLASGWSDGRKRLFALGPVGVTLFALSWFLLLLDPSARDPCAPPPPGRRCCRSRASRGMR